MSDLFSILQILLKYEPNGDISAEHDTLYLTGPEPEKLSEEESETLKSLHCFYDESTQSWMLFT